jgi:hypothetical protein
VPDQPFYGAGLAGEQSRGSHRLTVAHDSIFGNYTGWLSLFRLSLPLLFGLAICLQVLAYANKVLADPDTYWHIAIGRWILTNQAIPHQGIFSGTMSDAPWVAHEWLAEVLLAFLFDHFGWIGVAAATACCAAAALALLLRALLHVLAPVHALIAAVLAYFLTLPHILARPDIFALPILVLWVAALAAARAKNRAPSAWLALLMMLWANLHGGYIFGLGLAALFAGEAILAAPDWQGRLNAARVWALFAAVSLAAALMTPFGIDGLLLPFRLNSMGFALSQLIEWRSPDFQSLEPLELWLLLLLFGSFALGWRLPLMRLLMLLLLVHQSLQHRRFGELLGLVAPLLIAPALASQLVTPTSRGAASQLDQLMGQLAKPAGRGAILLVPGLVLALLAVVPRLLVHPDDFLTPSAAVNAVAAAHIDGPVLNDYGFGGYLLFVGRRPYIDGRAELYGDAFMQRYTEAVTLTSDKLPEILAQDNIAWTLFDPSRPAVKLLDHLPGWRRLYADDSTVVHVRDDAVSAR